MTRPVSPSMDCTQNGTHLKKFVENDHTYQFLVGLNPKYDQIQI